MRSLNGMPVTGFGNDLFGCIRQERQVGYGLHEHIEAIRLKETAWDHVYFGTVFTWFEVGRTELGRAAGMRYVELTRRGIGSFVTRAGARYLKPIPATGVVRIAARLAKMTQLRFIFAYEIHLVGSEGPAVTGYTEHACADTEGRLTRLPEDFRSAYQPIGDSVVMPDIASLPGESWTHELRVRYEETDAFGIVYNGNYFAWMEAAWSGRLMGGAWDIADAMQNGRALAVSEAHCRYVSPLTYDDPVAIRVCAEKTGATRVRLSYEMINQTSGDIAALGHTVHALTVNGKPARIPDDLLDALNVIR